MINNVVLVGRITKDAGSALYLKWGCGGDFYSCSKQTVYKPSRGKRG